MFCLPLDSIMPWNMESEALVVLGTVLLLQQAIMWKILLLLRG